MDRVIGNSAPEKPTEIVGVVPPEKYGEAMRNYAVAQEAQKKLPGMTGLYPLNYSRNRMNATRPRSRYDTEQSIATPWSLFNPLNDIFDFVVDLAADENNTKCPVYVTEKMDALSTRIKWHKLADPGRWLWLNPPFRNIEPWAAKCAAEAKLGARVCMLTPASTGTRWFHRHIFGQAVILLLEGRIIFDYMVTNGPYKGQWNTTPFPKDCILTLFNRDMQPQFVAHNPKDGADWGRLERFVGGGAA